MPSLTPEELQEARRRSGRLGGRPRKPTVDEARERALDELTPRALQVLKLHLGSEDEPNPGAWRAALRIFEHRFGPAPASNDIAMPTSEDEIAMLSWTEMTVLAARLVNELDAGADATAPALGES
jgi:hypothetical protein